MNQKQITELGTASIRSLLFKYAMPGIIAMTAMSLYNMVDSIFIGHGVGALALSGLTVAKPFMDICAAFGTLVGVGASSLVAIKLGEKDYRSANDILANVIILNVILGAIIMVVGLFWLDPILYAFGASEATIVYAREYMEIILLGNILTHIYYGLNSMLRSVGHPRISMYATILAKRRGGKGGVCVVLINPYRQSLLGLQGTAIQYNTAYLERVHLIAGRKGKGVILQYVFFVVVHNGIAKLYGVCGVWTQAIFVHYPNGFVNGFDSRHAFLWGRKRNVLLWIFQ